jgi:hypothetical protein
MTSVTDYLPDLKLHILILDVREVRSATYTYICQLFLCYIPFSPINILFQFILKINPFCKLDHSKVSCVQRHINALTVLDCIMGIYDQSQRCITLSFRILLFDFTDLNKLNFRMMKKLTKKATEQK